MSVCACADGVSAYVKVIPFDPDAIRASVFVYLSIIIAELPFELAQAYTPYYYTRNCVYAKLPVYIYTQPRLYAKQCNHIKHVSRNSG